MSDPVTALQGAAFDGGIATVTEVPLQGMITLRADLSDPDVLHALGTVMPGAAPKAGQVQIDGDEGLAWMSPDEALLLCAYAQVPDRRATLQSALGQTHALVVNVSDARASFRVSGPHAREVLAKLCPVDLSPGAFTQGMFRRTRLAQVPAALWLCEADAFQVICFRSQAQYVFDLLNVAGQAGSGVGLYC